MFETKKIHQVIRVFLMTTLVHLGATAPDVAADEEPAAEAPHGIYAAIWDVDAEPATLLRSDDPPSFVSPAGFRLDDIEVWLEEDKTRYMGVFRPAGGADHPLVGPLTEVDFEQARTTLQNSSGLCLAGFEIWQQAGKSLYAGVFEQIPNDPTCESQLFEIGLSTVEFSNKLQQHGASHHLVDFETVIESGQLRVSALWRLGAELAPPFAILAVNWRTFHERVHDLAKLGYQLADVDIQFGDLTPQAGIARHVVGSQLRTMLSGVWRASAGKDWFGADYHWNHLSCAHRLLGEGLEDSGIVKDETGNLTTICEEGDGGLAPVGQAMKLVTIEAYTDTVFQLPDCASPNHGEPMHNSGSGGPP